MIPKQVGSGSANPRAIYESDFGVIFWIGRGMICRCDSEVDFRIDFEVNHRMDLSECFLSEQHKTV